MLPFLTNTRPLPYAEANSQQGAAKAPQEESMTDKQIYHLTSNDTPMCRINIFTLKELGYPYCSQLSLPEAESAIKKCIEKLKTQDLSPEEYNLSIVAGPCPYS